MPWQLDGGFNNDGVHGLLEVKDYQSLHLLFSFCFEFVNTTSGLMEDGELTELSNFYS